MNPAEYRILTECATVAWLTLFLGLGMHWLLRRRTGIATKAAEPISAETTPGTSQEDVALTDEPAGQSAAAPPVPCAFEFNRWDLALGIGLVWMVLATSFASLAPSASSGEPASSEAEVSASLVLVTFLITQGLQVGLIWAYFSRVRQVNPIHLFGLTNFRPSRALGLSFLLLIPSAFISLGAAHWIVEIFRSLGFQPEEQQAVSLLRTRPDMGLRIVLFLGACVGAPIVEELLFRGLLYSSLKRYTDRWFAAIVSALLFGVVHAHLPALLPLSVLGFFFALAYEHTKSLTIPILMHALFNTSQILAALSHGASEN